MEIYSLCPFRVGTLLWEAQPGQLSLSITVKATLNLVHGGEAAPAPPKEQVDISGDQYWDKSTYGSIYRPSDIAPLKRRVDVILSGHAYAPGKSPVESLVARLRVGDLVKSVRVTGDRCWTRSSSGSGGGFGPFSVGRPLPFLRMPLRYERAAQSPENPIGIDPHTSPSLGQLALPNLEPIEPEGTVGFGAVAPTWPARKNLLFEDALVWAYGISGKLPVGPTPSGFNFEFFNAAPREQQIELLRAGTPIELECLHPEHVRLETHLPALRPQVFRIHPSSGRTEEIVLRCDTLWIDSDRGVVVLSFRGLTDVDGVDPQAIGKLVVAADPEGKRLRFEKIEKQLRELSPETLGPITSRRASSEEGVDPLSLRYDGVKSGQPSRVASGSPGAPPATAASSPPFEGFPRFESRSGFSPGAAFPGGSAPSPLKDDEEEDDDDEQDQTQDVVRAPRRSKPSYAAATPPAASPKAASAALPFQGDAPQAEKLEHAHALRAPAPRKTEPPIVPRTASVPPPPIVPRTASVPPPPIVPRTASVPPPPPIVPRTASIPPPPPPIVPRTASVPPPPPPIVPRTASVPPPPPPPPIVRRPTSVPPPPIAPSRPPIAPPPPMASRPASEPPPSPDSAEPISVEEIEEEDPDAITAEKPTRSPPRAPPSPLPALAPGESAELAFGPLSERMRESDSDLDPAQVPIERYATVSAELAQKGADRGVVLRGHRFTVAAWAAVDRHWTRAIAEQTERGERALLSAFDAAYVATQERLRRPIGVPEYARILVGLERGEVGRVLAELELQLSDLMRLQRVWTKKLADTPRLAVELQQATEDARRAPGGS